MPSEERIRWVSMACRPVLFDGEGQTAGMPDLLLGFDDVRFLDTERNRPVAERRGMRLTARREWLEGVEAYDFVVLHSGGYWRDHQDLGGLEDLGVTP